ncbi:hypothetical protein Bca101_025900 [Brassica carinata]
MEGEGKRKTAKERRMTSGTGAEPDRRNRKAEEKRDFLERERACLLMFVNYSFGFVFKKD